MLDMTLICCSDKPGIQQVKYQSLPDKKKKKKKLIKNNNNNKKKKKKKKKKNRQNTRHKIGTVPG